MEYIADFETNVTIPTNVWGYGICDLNGENIIIGNNLKVFLYQCSQIDEAKNTNIYFHNLKFDGKFILDEILKNGWLFSEKLTEEKQFNCLIDEMGSFYSIKLCFEVRGKRKNTVTFLDSYKLLPFSVDRISKDFKLPISKLKIDYAEYREPNHKITAKEEEYIKHDILIMAHALKFLKDNDITKMTIASSALHIYKSMLPKFDDIFPQPRYDKDIRQAYKGGYSYLLPNKANKEIHGGIVLDVNSLYPYVLRNAYLPYGEPLYFKGDYKTNTDYNLYIISFRCQFELKENFLPTIQIKGGGYFFSATEYLSSSNNEIVCLTLTNVDFELFKKHYDIFNLEVFGGYMFKSLNNMFVQYIDYWSHQKIKAKQEGNSSMYTLSKLMLNSLYGKFGTNSENKIKIPYLDNDIVKYRTEQGKDKKLVYLPVATFVTAYAREITISSGQANYDRFIYSDTDSLHLTGKEKPTNILIDDYELGAWKLESDFDRGYFIHSKCYIEEKDGKISACACAGLPLSSRIDEKGNYLFEFDDFKIGKIFTKLIAKTVNGGVLLQNSEFRIK